jgi:hypothetical protein
MQPDEEAVYDFCMGVVAKHELSDATYGRISQFFLNDQQIADLTALSGTYVTVGCCWRWRKEACRPAGAPFKPGEP